MAHWTFLTHHAHVLLQVAQNPDAKIEDLASSVGITTRSAVAILNDLESTGYIERERRGRRNHYVLHPDQPLRHPSNSAHSVNDLIKALSDLA